MKYEKELDAALTAAGLAGNVALGIYKSFEAGPTAPADISPAADKKVQETILRYLIDRFPDDAFVAEENTDSLKTLPHSGTRLWIVDPIDGSGGFVRKNNEFSVMITFVDRGDLAVGVVFEPARSRLTYGVKGEGCWRRDEPGTVATRCSVSDVRELSKSGLVQSRSREPGLLTDHVMAIKPAIVKEANSAGLKMVMIARGEADIYVNYYKVTRDWDIAAAHVLVEEAGGKVCDLRGQKIVYGTKDARHTHGVLATNGHIRDAVLAVLPDIR